MTSRTYDYILTVASVSGFQNGNNIIGVNSKTEGTIANVDSVGNNVKVKLSNLLQEFIDGEFVRSTVIVTTGGSANTNVAPYTSPTFSSALETANSNITSIATSTFILEKNALSQQPLVRLYTLYYPGEWYPPNANGNPTKDGAGYSWPADFPYRFAEVRGDTISDIGYTVIFDGEEYTPYPMESGGIGIDSSGKINELSLTISNFDNLIATLVDDPFLVGNNASNAVTATVNGELVTNIDPRTVPGDPLFDQDIVDSRGGNNVAFDYSSTTDVGGTWTKLKIDTRDLLGGVVRVQTTFSNFLDFWPEFSTVRSKFEDFIEVYSSLPYRVGDVIRSNANTNTETITTIQGNLIKVSSNDVSTFSIGDRLYIVNSEADTENFIQDTFRINNLEALNEQVAVFNLTSWLQFFKLRVPKRKYFKNICPWQYRGEECQYPSSGTGTIPGSTKTANGFFDVNNETVLTAAEDVCAKNFDACILRNNERHYGGWPGTNRTIPR